MPVFMQIISNGGIDMYVLFPFFTLLHVESCVDLCWASKSATRQACAVYFKNRVQRAYFSDPSRPRPDAAPIAESDRVYIKQNILQLLVASPSRPVSAQLASCFRTLVSHDFPEKWPGLLEELHTLLVSDDPRAIYGGLVGFLEVMRACRWVLLLCLFVCR